MSNQSEGFDKSSLDGEEEPDSIDMPSSEATKAERENFLTARRQRRQELSRLSLEDMSKLILVLMEGLSESSQHVGESKGYLRETRAIAQSVHSHLKEMEQDRKLFDEQLKTDFEQFQNKLTLSLDAKNQLLVEQIVHLGKTQVQLEKTCTQHWELVPRGFLPFWLWKKTTDVFQEKPLAAIISIMVMMILLLILVMLGLDLGAITKLLP